MRTFFARPPWLALCLALVQQPQSPPAIHGRVVDADGKPVAGARICSEWSFPDPAKAPGEAPAPSATALRQAATSDERGEFESHAIGAALLFALAADGKTGALAPVDPPAGAPADVKASAPLELRLAPLIEVRCRFDVKIPGAPPKKTALWIGTEDFRAGFVAECISESSSFRVALPPGRYRLWYSTDAVNLYSMSQLEAPLLELHAGQDALDLGAFALDLPLVVHPQGVVLDAEGKPARASLGESWSVFQEQMIPQNGFETDENGRFQGNVEVYGETDEHPLLALDRKREQAALVFWKTSEVAKPLELHLAPAVRVFGSYKTDSGERPLWTNTYASLLRTEGDPSRAPRVAECQSNEARFEFRLPPGKYRLNGYGTNTQDANTDVVLAAGERERDLGAIVLPQTVIARNTGKAAMPWHLTDARGLAKDAKLADFRGKWVLLEFWGFW